MSELRPCPFCAGESDVRQPDSGFFGDRDRFVVSCKRCYATAWHRNDDTTCQVAFDTEDEAIAAWNTRAGEQKAYEQGYEDGISNFMPIRQEV